MFQKSLFFFLIFLWFAVPAKAQPTRDDLLKQQQQLLKELSDLNEDLHSIKKDKKLALGAYTVVKRKIAARESLIKSLNRDIHLLTENIYQNQIEIYRLKKELDTLRLHYGQSLVFAYKNRGNFNYLNFLFSAQGFNDAMKRVTYLKHYRKYRETQAETINKTRAVLGDVVESLNQNRSKKSNVLSEQSSQLKVLEEDKKEKDFVVKQLKAQEKEIAARIRQRQKDKIRLRNAISAALKKALADAERSAKRNKKSQEEERRRSLAEQHEKELKRIKEYQAKNKENKQPKEPQPEPKTDKSDPAPPPFEEPAKKQPDKEEAAKPVERPYSPLESTDEGLKESLIFEKNRGRLPWPVEDGFVYMQFGKQNIPGTKLFADNDGVFIKTKVGEKVRCVAEGEVLTIFELDQYQAVMVKHGKYFTTYNMLNDVRVKVGDQVKAGSVLGHVAADLDGEGQLEFQVLNEKKTFQNPEKWLRAR